MSNSKKPVPNSPVVSAVVIKEDNEDVVLSRETQNPEAIDQKIAKEFAELQSVVVDADGNPITENAGNSKDEKDKVTADVTANTKKETKEKSPDQPKDYAMDDKNSKPVSAKNDKDQKPTAATQAESSKSDDKADKSTTKDDADKKDTKTAVVTNVVPAPTPSKTTAEDKTNSDNKEKLATADQAADETETKLQSQSKSTSTTSTPEKSSMSNTQGPKRVAILGGNRIPFARSNSSYADDSNIDMLTAALNGLIERFDLQGERMGEVVAGAVLKLSRDLNLTREAALNTALDPHTPAYDISQACATGLQSTFAASNKIALGIIDSAITGGVDTTSDAPIAVGDGLRKALIKLGAARNNKQRFAALTSINPKDLLDAPANGEPRTGLSMGEHQAITALEWNISREAQDELAYKSHKNLARAYDEGFFDDLMTPYNGLTRDNNLRPDTTMEKLAKLKPVFGKKNANPTMTAANSTPLTDGASCVLLGTEEWATERGLKVMAYITHQETSAVDFIGKEGPREGLLMAPAYAIPRMLKRAGLTFQDFDFYEIHEAFASQVLATLAALDDETFAKERLGLDKPLGKIDMDKLNVNGSSLAAGHPFAATGGRILATSAKLLDQKGSGRVLISICAAGGQGVTCILEK